MEAQVWTLIALLGGSYITMVMHLGGRIGRLEQRADRLEDRFERLERRFDRLEQRFGRLEQRFDGLLTQIEHMNSKLDDHLRRHAG